MQSPALLGRQRRAAGALALRLHRAEQVLLLALGRDPADRRDRVRDAPAQPRPRLRVGQPDHRRRSPSDASVEEVRTTLEGAGSTTPRSPRPRATSSARTSFQIEADIEPEQVREVQPALDDEFGAGRERLRLDHDRPDLRRAGGPQRRLRDHLLAAGDLRLRGVPLRAQVRGAGDHRRHPRHPDHGRRLLPGRAGGDIGNRRGLPDHPRLLALRHRDRLRPNTRERAAPAARDLLPDRQPLDERGPDPVADHRPLERLPGRGAVHLRRHHAAGLRLRDDGRDRLGYLLVDLHRLAGPDRLEGARARLPPPPRADRGADGLRARLPRGERDRPARGRRPEARGRARARASRAPEPPGARARAVRGPGRAARATGAGRAAAPSPEAPQAEPARPEPRAEPAEAATARRRPGREARAERGERRGAAPRPGQGKDKRARRRKRKHGRPR